MAHDFIKAELTEIIEGEELPRDAEEVVLDNINRRVIRSFVEADVQRFVSGSLRKECKGYGGEEDERAGGEHFSRQRARQRREGERRMVGMTALCLDKGCFIAQR